ncbi:hypothetical protein ACHAXT_002974 [Thalassiosira profunda]
MASPQQPAPPSNPFDGFDTYSTVAQQPPQPTPSPQQWPPQPPAASPTAANPFAAPAPPAAAATANPFALPPGGMVPPQPQQQLPAIAQHPHQPQQQLATLPPNAIVQSPWALQNSGGMAPAAPAPAATGQSYDPLGIFGAPAQQPPPQQIQQFQQPAYQQHGYQQPGFQAQQQPGYSAQNPQYAIPPQQPVQPQPPSAQQKLQAEVQQFNLESSQTDRNESIMPAGSDDEGLALVDVELDDNSDAGAENLENRKKDGEFLDSAAIKGKKSPKTKGGGGGRGRNSWDRNPDIAPPPPMVPGRNQAEYLAENSAPPLSSPLPKPELVHHSGYVLSRISFRTVLMRKWKQTFWIQYGPTQLLFFRTFDDYIDWLNNPYHTAKAREFLVKLRVDFVSDLKKSSVMGYQVTQVRRKPYGKNVMLHFKLERWMDYGPTIAAAFAAREEEMVNSPSHRQHRNDDDGMNASNDVSALRKIILGCMRNARDAAMVAATRDQPTDMGEAVGYRGRYDEDHGREGRIPNSTRNMGYHQAFSAESSQRRRAAPGDVDTEPSEDAAPAEAPQPVVDLLG